MNAFEIKIINKLKSISMEKIRYRDQINEGNNDLNNIHSHTVLDDIVV